MKKAVVVLLGTLFLSSCSSTENIYLPRPQDTNLKLWITQEVSEDDLKELELYEPGFGVDKFVHDNVYYEISPYPDCSSNNSCVTSIESNSPSYYVYGITIESDLSYVYNKLTENGFQFIDNSNEQEYVTSVSYRNGNVNFSFTKNESIVLKATVTNNNNIIF